MPLNHTAYRILTMNHVIAKNRLRFAIKAFITHLGISLLITLLVSLLIFQIWYPYPYYKMIGGLKLMGLIMGVDLVCGPLLTFIVANPAKPKKELIRDFGLIGIIQFAALCYGLNALAESRPVALAFDRDRFYVATAVEIEPERLAKAPEVFRSLPLFDIYQVGTRDAANSTELFEGVNLSMAGIPPAARPDWWIPRTQVEENITQARIPLKALIEKYPDRAAVIRQYLSNTTKTDNLYYLPLTSEKTLDWIMVFNDKNETVAYIPVDGFQ